MGEVNVHMGHMGNARSLDKDQPTCFDQAKSKGGGKDKWVVAKTLEVAMCNMWDEGTW